MLVQPMQQSLQTKDPSNLRDSNDYDSCNDSASSIAAQNSSQNSFNSSQDGQLDEDKLHKSPRNQTKSFCCNHERISLEDFVSDSDNENHLTANRKNKMNFKDDMEIFYSSVEAAPMMKVTETTKHISNKKLSFDDKTDMTIIQDHSDVYEEVPRTLKFEESSKQSLTFNGKLDPAYQYLSSNLRLLNPTNTVRELLTVLRDRRTCRADYRFYADRLIRLVVEEGLNKLPYISMKVKTPTGCVYSGLSYVKGNCGVSIIRSGEAMEKALRDCCRSIRIGKILISRVDDMNKPNGRTQVVYSKFPSRVDQRQILLMYPIIDDGETINCALKVLEDHGVQVENVHILSLFATETGLQNIFDSYPSQSVLCAEILKKRESIVTNFVRRYFGTD
ncbi:hypothetical protein SNEBB_006172 [Seison nebaliae]|nr:hypothetical protein SNEBB_006172 [Seison nebaliae]